MTATAQPAMSRTARLAGYLFALSAGAVWGTTGPLSTALYRAGEAITGIGFWRLLVGLAGLVLYGCLRPELFRIERRGGAGVGPGGGGPGGPVAGAAPLRSAAAAGARAARPPFRPPGPRAAPPPPPAGLPP